MIRGGVRFEREKKLQDEDGEMGITKHLGLGKVVIGLGIPWVGLSGRLMMTLDNDLDGKDGSG